MPGLAFAYRQGGTRESKDEEEPRMNIKILRSYAELAQPLGLQADGESGVIFGSRDGYTLTVAAPNAERPYWVTVSVSATGPVAMPQAALDDFARQRPEVISLTQNGPLFQLRLKDQKKAQKLGEVLAPAVDALLSMLRASGFMPSCCSCARTDVPVDAYYAAGNLLPLCPDCAARMQQDRDAALLQTQQKPNNTLVGIIGALLGSLIGAVSIVLLSRLGYVSALSGLLMAVCTLKGYELLGGKRTRASVWICIAVMVIMTVLADAVDWAIAISSQVDEIDFFTVLINIPYFLSEGILETGAYLGNLALLFLFMALGVIPTIHGQMAAQKNSARFYRLGGGAAAQPVTAQQSAAMQPVYAAPAAPEAPAAPQAPAATMLNGQPLHGDKTEQ